MSNPTFSIKLFAFIAAMKYYGTLKKEKGWSFKQVYESAIEYIVTGGRGYDGNGESSLLKKESEVK